MNATTQSFWFYTQIKPLEPVAVLEAHIPERRDAHNKEQNWDYVKYWDDDMGLAYPDPVYVYEDKRISEHIWELIQQGADVVRVTYYVGRDKKTGKRLKKTYYALDNYFTYKVGRTIQSYKPELED